MLYYYWGDSMEEKLKDENLIFLQIVNNYYDVNEFKKILDGCAEQYITLNFGDHKACVVTRNSIRNVMPEVIVRNN